MKEELVIEGTLEGGDPICFSDVEFSGAFFDNCRVISPPDPSIRPRFERCMLRRCIHRSVFVNGAILDEVLVDGIGSRGRIPLFLSGTVFRHVVVRGRVCPLKINEAPSGCDTPASESLWKAANREFYESVDWALDISQAEFVSGPTFETVPGHLIRRDPETQVLVRRSSIEDSDLSSIDWGKSSFGVALRWFLDFGQYDSVVLAAERKSPSFAEQCDVLAMLRAGGIAEKD